MSGRALLAACFTFVWLVSRYRTWLSSTPIAVQDRDRIEL